MAVREIAATVGQRLLWMMDHYRGTTEYGAFNCPVLCRVRGRLDRAALTAAVDALVDRHESLRTVIVGRGRDLLQRVTPAPVPVPVTWRDVTAEPDPRAAADAEVAVELRTSIDVRLCPLRVTVWLVSPTETVVCVNLHHIATDAWSTGVLFRELVDLYARGGDATALPPVPWQYADVAEWQGHQQRSGELDRQHAYWLRQLDGSRLAQPPRRHDATTASDTGAIGVDVPPATTRRLRALAKSTDTTLFSVLLAAYFAQLHRAGGQDDLTVASLFANRPRPESHGTVGFLANMVMLRLRAAGPDPRALLRAAHETTIGAFAHQEQPFQTLPPHLVDAGGMRADDVVFQFVTELQHKVPAGGAEWELMVPEGIGSRFSFELAVAPLGNGLRPVLFYRRDWFDDDTAADFVAGYGRLLEDLVSGI